MNYHGIEIFYQNLGNADSIFIRYWWNGTLTNILIDGGWRTSAQQVKLFLAQRAKESGDPTIHHLVCTHSDDDHVGGLAELAKDKTIPVQTAWIHDTRLTHQVLTPSRVQLMEKIGAKRLLQTIHASEETRHSLLRTLEARKVDIQQPFTGALIGPMVVLGPTPEFFDQQISMLQNSAILSEIESRLSQRQITTYMESMLDQTTLEAKAAKEDKEKELGDEPTSPSNEVSTVIALPWQENNKEEIHLFTGDVGREGMGEVLRGFADHLKQIRWLDVPHHGSRRSMTQDMVDHLAPNTAFISCKGSHKHPSRKLVNALKKHGKVYSTHYSVGPDSWLRQHYGNVPALNLTAAFPLYDKAA